MIRWAFSPVLSLQASSLAMENEKRLRRSRLTSVTAGGRFSFDFLVKKLPTGQRWIPAGHLVFKPNGY